ncbi:hypothetical protein [Pantoea dispersa]|uniref:Uncharacterized protein n=1 Tax=Pantoea dispersa TaxID=59814 RepID=A0ABY2ZZ73_9GAMM|nr:hypothetical protein [Pantoea dispersa]TQC75571.1 hypothetical protein FK492_06525 [Pantoea dispersa]
MTQVIHGLTPEQLANKVYSGIGLKTDKIGCRVQLNPNGSDLRCGDRVNNVNWNLNEGVVELCEVCKLKLRNASLLEALNRRHPDSRSEKGGKNKKGGF